MCKDITLIRRQKKIFNVLRTHHTKSALGIMGRKGFGSPAYGTGIPFEFPGLDTGIALFKVIYFLLACGTPEPAVFP
jgi:hypothetical protein